MSSSHVRVPRAEHRAHPWRVHELTRDFRLEDVWEIPGEFAPGDLPELVALIAVSDPSQRGPRVVRWLFRARWWLGARLGWDRPDAGVGTRVPTLSDRLPADLRDAAAGPGFDALPFRSLYLLDYEYAAEIANGTVHAVLHIGLVSGGPNRSRARMAVLVKPNGFVGSAYMAAIKPFRHLLVYPSMLRDIARSWRDRPA